MSVENLGDSMKKGQRPSRHIRKVRTKKGKKRVLVNPRIRKKKKKIIRKKKSYSQGVFQFAPRTEAELMGTATITGAQIRIAQKRLDEKRERERAESLKRVRDKIREDARIAFGKLGRFDKLKESEQQSIFERLASLDELERTERFEEEARRKVPKERLKRFGRTFGREAARFATRKTREKEEARKTERKEKEDIRQRADTARPVKATVVDAEFEGEEPPAEKPLRLGISEEEAFRQRKAHIAREFKPRPKEMPRRKGRPPKPETIFRGTGIEVIQ